MITNVVVFNLYNSSNTTPADHDTQYELHKPANFLHIAVTNLIKLTITMKNIVGGKHDILTILLVSAEAESIFIYIGL